MRRAGTRNALSLCALLALLAAPQPAVRAEEPVQAAADEQTLTGQLIAAWCVLNEGSLCLNKNYKSAARNCIRMGSPMALLVGEGNTVYHLATPAPALKHQLANWVNAQVTVRGKVTLRNGKHYIVVSHAERAAESAARASTP